jgi:hypothetical protein
MIRLYAAVVVLLSCTFFTLPSFAQFQDPAPVSWGEVDDLSVFENSWEELDPDAHAIILADYGILYFDNMMELKLKRHTRVQILNPDESDYTEITVVHNNDNRRRRLDDLRAQTLNPSDDGVVATELDGDDFYMEEFSNGWRETKFTFPNLRPGSVVEYNYELTISNPTTLETWNFQHDEPIVHSEYRVYIPDPLVYSIFQRGYYQFSDHTTFLYNPNYNLSSNFNQNLGGVAHRWVMKDMPAIRDEPYMTTVDDYRSKIRFQLRQVREIATGSGYTTGYGEDVLDSWPSISTQLYRSKDFGREIRTNRAIRNKVEELTEGLDSDLEKAQAIYDYISKSVLWDGRRGLFPDAGVRDAFEDGGGNGPDITLLLVSMLDEADIEATPLLISRRDHGMIDPDITLIDQFNHVIAHAEIDGESYLMEPLYQDLPFGMLTSDSHNGQGLEIVRRDAGWVDISPSVNRSHRLLAIVAMDENAELSGQVQSSMDGYAALDHRRELREQNTTAEEFSRNELLTGLPDSEVTDIELTGVDDVSSPIGTNFSFSNDAAAQQAGDFIYFNPFFMHQIDENPFQLRDRNFPVNYDTGMSYSFTLNLQLPPGYELEEAPQSIQHNIGRDLLYRQIAREAGNQLQIMTTFQVNKLMFTPDEYEFLREFYNNVVSSQAEQIVLKRVEEEPSAESTGTGE